MSLKTRVIIIFYAVSILPLIVFGIVSYNLTYRDRLANITDRLNNIASQSEHKLNSYFQLVKEEFYDTSEDVDLREMIGRNLASRETSQGVVNQLESHLENSKIITNLSVVDTEGIVIASTMDLEKGDKLPFETVISYTTDVDQIDLVQKDEGGVINSVFIYTTPLIIDGAQVGSYIAESDSVIVEALVSTYSELGDSGEISLGKKIDSEKLTYLFPLRFDPEAAFKRTVNINDSSVALTRAMNRLEKVYVSDTKDYRGVQVIAATRYIDLADWGMVVEMDRSEVLSPVIAYQRDLIIYLLFSIPIIVLISYLVASSIINPITKLTDFSRRISEGDFAQKINISTNDEIGQLAQSFNAMSAKLTQSYSDLENKVAERTKELEAIKSNLEISKSSLEAEVAKRTKELEQAKTGLEAEVAKRTAELNAKLEEIEKMNKFMIGRENRMAELKKKLQDAGVS